MLNEGPELDLAVNGEGVTPSDVSIRALASMLNAMASLIEAVATESGIQPPRVAVHEVTSGSAHYGMRAASPEEEPAFSATIAQVYSIAKARGRGASEPARAALLRLFRSCDVGPVSIGGRVIRMGRIENLAPITMAAPIEIVPTIYSSTTVIYGRVVGVESKSRGTRMIVKISPLTGQKIDLDAETVVAERAGRLFNKTVRVKCSAVRSDDASSGWEIVEITQWHETDFAAVTREIAGQFKASKLSIDPDEVMRNIRGD